MRSAPCLGNWAFFPPSTRVESLGFFCTGRFKIESTRAPRVHPVYDTADAVWTRPAVSKTLGPGQVFLSLRIMQQNLTSNLKRHNPELLAPIVIRLIGIPHTRQMVYCLRNVLVALEQLLRSQSNQILARLNCLPWKRTPCGHVHLQGKNCFLPKQKPIQCHSGCCVHRRNLLDPLLF